MQLEQVSCPVCGSEDARLLVRARDLNTLMPGEFTLMRCRQCSMAYVNPRPTREEIAKYYPKHYWAPPPPEDTPPYLDVATRTALATIARDFPGGRVLDVGCGVGKVAAVMRERGLDAVGLEPYEHACNIAREHYGLECVCAFLQQADLPGQSFDAVTIFDVLEHVDDPVGDLRKARSILKPGGLVFVKVPNIDALQFRVLGRWWYWLDIPRHLMHFSPRSLHRALQEAGFADVRCRAIPDTQGAMVFQASILYWLRSAHLARRGIEVVPADGQSASEALEGKVYPGVPSAGKRLFRWVAKYILYAPFAFENLIGRSVELVGMARK